MLSGFIKFGKEHDFLPGKKKILLAVSGGIDSMVMTDLFSRAGFAFDIAHCNFLLRGKESAEDAEFVKNFCKLRKIKFHCREFNTEEYAIKNKQSIQHAARNLRYEWFSELLAKQKYKFLATAHHLDDSIETFFINLLRGSGIHGLTGIPEKRQDIIRPLICFSRKEINSYAISSGIEWREDSSNASADYLRNRIRQNLSPLLLELQPEFPGIMQKNFEHLRQTAAFQDEFAENLLKKFLKKVKHNSWKINTQLLKKETKPEAKLQLMLRTFNILTSNPGSMLASGQAGKLYYSGEYRLLRDRAFLLIEKKKDSQIGEFPISSKDRFVQLEDISLELKTSKIHSKTKVSRQISRHDLDSKNLKFPLQLRQWKAGDYFFPLGMTKRKKVSDFLIDAKVNRFEKEKCMVLLSGTNIICILGHRIDERYKVNEETKNIFSISIKQN